MDIQRRLGRHAEAVTRVAVTVGLIVVVLGVPASAHDDGTTSHLWNSHVKIMRQPGTINDAANPVHWTRLKGVPAGLADGVDDGIDGAGFGLNKTGNLFSVDTAEVQHRLTAACRPGRAIGQVDADGSIHCVPVSLPQVLTLTDDISVPCDQYDWCTMGTLTLGSGTWAASAKIRAQSFSADELLRVECQLVSNGFVDTAEAEVTAPFPTVTMPMQVVASIAAGEDGDAFVQCRDFIGGVGWNDLSIIAIRVAG